jgi:acetyltransferase-like isoleucine patch superfamily enzyme
VRSRFCLRQRPGASVSIAECCVLDNDLTIECGGTLRVGARTIFGHHCTVAAVDLVEIGEDCLIAEMVSIRDHNHRFDRLDVPVRLQGMTSAPVHIGRNVWIGGKSTITKGVRIGDNAVIGANAVVTHDVPANAIAVGVPARVIKFRDGTPLSPHPSSGLAEAPKCS